jgi:hypothetical protein
MFIELNIIENVDLHSNKNELRLVVHINEIRTIKL